MRGLGRGRIAVLTLAASLAACSSGGSPSTDAGMPGFDVLAGFRCETDLDCNDRVACTVDHCEDGVCTADPCPDCCPDGLTCTDLGCRSAPEPCTEDSQCGDDLPCTIDRCRDAEFCEHLPQDELCEDGESCFPALGCIPSPPESCDSGDECTRGNECLGEWSCQPEFGCQFVSPPDCDDGDECTVDSCSIDDGACAHPIRDADADGYGDLECGADDCNDESESINPGAAETCDFVDNDCDGNVDESCCVAGDPCTTTCGSAGTTTCNPDGSIGPCAASPETCSGVDDDCDGNVDEGFDCRAGEMGSCTASCGSTGMRTCDGTCRWEACVPPAETCSGDDEDCDGTTDEGFACVAGSSASCTTICGSTGSRACLGDCSFDTCVPPAEVCNGVDDDCDAAPDDGFACVRGSTRTCTTSCGSTGTRRCRNDCTLAGCAPPAEGCNGVDDDCDGSVDETSACTPGSSRSCATSCGSTGTETCGSTCTYGACAPPVETCNGSDDDCDGACDDGFTCCRGATRDCSMLGFGSGTATCRNDCSGFDTSSCTSCGDGTVDSGEQCDGSNLNGNDCTTLGMGFTGGTLGCTSSCTFDTAACTVFNPSGVYDVTPTASYTCALGLVSYSTSVLTFTDDGTSLVVNGSVCPMTGASARVSRTINVSCTLSGICTETYSLSGTFSTDTTWTGILTATFVGSCIDCVDQSHTMTGTKR